MLDDAWGAQPSSPNFGPAIPAQQPLPQVPQKVFQGGNLPQKVFQGGNVPQKVFENGTGPGYNVGMQGMPQNSMEIARLQSIVQRLMQENQTQRALANTRATKGLSVAEICFIVVALVFIVLVVYLISLIRALKP